MSNSHHIAYNSWSCSKCNSYRKQAMQWAYSSLYKECKVWVFNSTASRYFYLKHGSGCQGCVRMCEHKVMGLAMLLAKLDVRV